MKTQLGFSGAFLISVIMFLYKIVPSIRKLQSFNGWDQPQMAADLGDALMWALIGLALGLGVNLGPLIGNLLKSTGILPPSNGVDKERV